MARMARKARRDLVAFNEKVKRQSDAVYLHKVKRSAIRTDVKRTANAPPAWQSQAWENHALKMREAEIKKQNRLGKVDYGI